MESRRASLCTSTWLTLELDLATGLLGEEPIGLWTLNVSQGKSISGSELYHHDELEQYSALPQKKKFAQKSKKNVNIFTAVHKREDFRRSREPV